MYWLQKSVAIVMGSVLVAIGVNLFLVPHRLMDGGMIGIGRPHPPYTIVGPLHTLRTERSKERLRVFPVLPVFYRKRQQPASVRAKQTGRTRAGEAKFLEKINRKRMK
ncbi:YitT family protein [Brevibacillus parabrevis]|nr:YitT family protein [Brevibacillus parabrevis]